MRVRFAPSPSGYLHVGNLRTALLNYLWVRAAKGEFMLRIDDTDSERCKPEYEEALKQDLQWLGLNWDLSEHQSKRLQNYLQAAEILKAKGRLYDCYETQEELELQRKVNLSQGQPPIYNRAALQLSDSEKQEHQAKGRKPHWRFLLSDKVITWQDYGRGEVSFQAGHLSDPVLFREDGRPLYTMSSVVDDGEFAITHIVRGEDHVVNSAVQIDLFHALEYPVPHFAHVPLLLDKHGKSLSKRLGSLSVRELKEADINKNALMAYLVHLGLSQAAEGSDSLEDLIANFDISAYGRASPRYDDGELQNLNVKYLRQSPYGAVKDKIASLGLKFNEKDWEFLRPNIDSLEDLKVWQKILFNHADFISPDYTEEEQQFLQTCADCLPDSTSIDDSTWQAWLTAIKQASDRKGKELFIPLRRALTGLDNGPALPDILAYLPHDEIIRRLQKS